MLSSAIMSTRIFSSSVWPMMRGENIQDVEGHLAAQVVLPGDVAHDGVGLGQLRLAVRVVGQVGEVQAVRELVVEPAGLVEVRSW